MYDPMSGQRTPELAPWWWATLALSQRGWTAPRSIQHGVTGENIPRRGELHHSWPISPCPPKSWSSSSHGKPGHSCFLFMLILVFFPTHLWLPFILRDNMIGYDENYHPLASLGNPMAIKVIDLQGSWRACLAWLMWTRYTTALNVDH